MHLTAALPHLVLVRIQVQQVILNLIRNSIDALALVQGTPRQVTIRSG
jgi:nitrogen-specific signal transduction histidine kinase